LNHLSNQPVRYGAAYYRLVDYNVGTSMD